MRGQAARRLVAFFLCHAHDRPLLARRLGRNEFAIGAWQNVKRERLARFTRKTLRESHGSSGDARLEGRYQIGVPAFRFLWAMTFVFARHPINLTKKLKTQLAELNGPDI